MAANIFKEILDQFERERKSAEHLLYVSLKYTKTSEVILNLLIRWEAMIDRGIELLIQKAKKKKSDIPTAPKARELLVRKLYKDKIVLDIMDLYAIFRRIYTTEKIREFEFRKNLAVRVTIDNKETVINLEKLHEWDALLREFYFYIRKMV